MPMGDKEKHESYATLQISRVSSSKPVNLFGSSIKHSQLIALRIHPASKERSLNQDWYFAEASPYIEVQMSQTQFAEAITSLNQGSGVPVTLTHINGKYVDKCPEENKRQEFEKELEGRMKSLGNKLKQLTEEAKQILSDKKAPSKAEKESILKQIESLEYAISGGIPFVYSQFNEQMDKTVLEAKGEVEAFVQNKINSLGIEGLKAETLMLNSNEE